MTYIKCSEQAHICKGYHTMSKIKENNVEAGLKAIQTQNEQAKQTTTQAQSVEQALKSLNVNVSAPVVLSEVFQTNRVHTLPSAVERDGMIDSELAVYMNDAAIGFELIDYNKSKSIRFAFEKKALVAQLKSFNFDRKSNTPSRSGEVRGLRLSCIDRFAPHETPRKGMKVYASLLDVPISDKKSEVFWVLGVVQSEKTRKSVATGRLTKEIRYGVPFKMANPFLKSLGIIA